MEKMYADGQKIAWFLEAVPTITAAELTGLARPTVQSLKGGQTNALGIRLETAAKITEAADKLRAQGMTGKWIVELEELTPKGWRLYKFHRMPGVFDTTAEAREAMIELCKNPPKDFFSEECGSVVGRFIPELEAGSELESEYATTKPELFYLESGEHETLQRVRRRTAKIKQG